jgi:hypothetical protein
MDQQDSIKLKTPGLPVVRPWGGLSFAEFISDVHQKATLKETREKRRTIRG